MRMNFSVGMGRNLSMHEIAKHVIVAEENGFREVTFVDQPNLSRDVYAMMVVAALNTSRIKIGHGVTDTYTYHPWVTANATASLNELAGGRAFLGIGVGGTYGKTMKPRKLAELRNAVQFIRDYTSGKDAEFDGEVMHSEWIRDQFPIYIASSGPKSCQLAGEIGDGVILATPMMPEIVRRNVELVHEGAERVGRDPAEIDIWLRTLVYVAESKEAARREVAGYAVTKAYATYQALLRNNPNTAQQKELLDTLNPGILDELEVIHNSFDPYQHELTDASQNILASQEVVDSFLLTGTPDDICDQIYNLGKAGVNNISTVLFTVTDKVGMMKEIGNHIMPNFRN
jgi:5,10-methylenetetrahydromethanopterin reductase